MKSIKNIMRYLVVAGALLAGFSSGKADAAETETLINVNFKPTTFGGSYYDGSGAAEIEGAAPGATYYWNRYSTNSGTNLSPTYAIGSGSAIINYSFRVSGTATIPNSGFGDSSLYSLMAGYLYMNGSAGGSISVTGLDPNTSYNAFFYTQGDKSVTAQQNTNLKVTVNGVMTFSQSAPTNTSENDLIIGQNVLKSVVETDDYGTLSFLLQPNSGTMALVNGFQLQALSLGTGGETPEPGTMVLIGVGGLMISAYTRMKSKKEDVLDA